MVHDGCGNAFHKYCLVKWVEVGDGKCPICRAIISESMTDEERWAMFETTFAERKAQYQMLRDGWTAGLAHAHREYPGPNFRSAWDARHPGKSAQQEFYKSVLEAKAIRDERIKGAERFWDCKRNLILAQESIARQEIRRTAERRVARSREAWEKKVMSGTGRSLEEQEDREDYTREYYNPDEWHARSAEDEELLDEYDEHHRKEVEKIEENLRQTVAFYHWQMMQKKDADPRGTEWEYVPYPI